MRTIRSVTTEFLHLPPSCIEYVPYAVQFFVIGTYKLESSEKAESEQQRRGSILLYEIKQDTL